MEMTMTHPVRARQLARSEVRTPIIGCMQQRDMNDNASSSARRFVLAIV